MLVDLAELVDFRFPKESFANFVAVLNTGNLNAGANAPIVNGGAMRVSGAMLHL